MSSNSQPSWAGLSMDDYNVGTAMHLIALLGLDRPFLQSYDIRGIQEIHNKATSAKSVYLLLQEEINIDHTNSRDRFVRSLVSLTCDDKIDNAVAAVNSWVPFAPIHLHDNPRTFCQDPKTRVIRSNAIRSECGCAIDQASLLFVSCSPSGSSRSPLGQRLRITNVDRTKSGMNSTEITKTGSPQQWKMLCFSRAGR